MVDGSNTPTAQAPDTSAPRARTTVRILDAEDIDDLVRRLGVVETSSSGMHQQTIQNFINRNQVSFCPMLVSFILIAYLRFCAMSRRQCGYRRRQETDVVSLKAKARVRQKSDEEKIKKGMFLPPTLILEACQFTHLCRLDFHSSKS